MPATSREVETTLRVRDVLAFEVACPTFPALKLLFVFTENIKAGIEQKRTGQQQKNANIEFSADQTVCDSTY